MGAILPSKDEIENVSGRTNRREENVWGRETCYSPATVLLCVCVCVCACMHAHACENVRVQAQA